MRLIVAQFVKPFVNSNKNDYVDAEAIAEAVGRKNMRFVPLKTEDQLDLQAIHRVRDRLISRRTAVINQLPAFLLERGMVFAKTPAKLQTLVVRVDPVLSQRISTPLPSEVLHCGQGGSSTQACDTEVLDPSHANTVSENSLIESSLKCIPVSASRTVRLSRRSRTQHRLVSE